jgi:Zn-dependent peptidase ImmA (M78 family)
MVPDNKYGFGERPFYEADEIDSDCEGIVRAFLMKRHGEIRYPITTDDLTVLIEQEGAVLDSSVDLSHHKGDVEGMTQFFADEEPKVSISDRLSAPFLENRLRSTLAHEWGHVHFHGPLWQTKFHANLFDPVEQDPPVCHRDTILDGEDWMEWQAGYVSGAILMPAKSTRRLVSDICQLRGWHANVEVTSSAATELISAVVETFAVSQEAARVRLQKLHLLTDATDQYALFGK